MLHRYPLPKYKIPKRFLAKHLEITAITTGAGAEIAAILRLIQMRQKLTHNNKLQ